MVAPTKGRVVQHDGVTAPPDQERHTGPFAAQTNVTRSPEHVVVSEVTPSLGQPYSLPEPWLGYRKPPVLPARTLSTTQFD